MFLQAAGDTSGSRQPIGRSAGKDQRVEGMVPLGCDGFRFPRGGTAAKDYYGGTSWTFPTQTPARDEKGMLRGPGTWQWAEMPVAAGSVWIGFIDIKF